MGFYGLEIAKSALTISQRAITLTGQNIANANTVGYTRQRFVTQAIDPAALASRFGNLETGAIGGGVEVQILDQIRNDFIDRELRRESASLGQWETRTEELEFIETLLNETSNNSISKTLADFFNSINELFMDPVNEEIRTNVQQNAIKLSETFNHYYDQLVALQNTLNDTMKVTTDRINDLLTNIADYNKQVYAYELGGDQANDLRDKRNVLLDELAVLVNIESVETAAGHTIVTVDGVELVNHTTTTLLEARPDLTGVVSGEADYYEIYYAGTNTPFEYSDGELEAYRYLRDGNTVNEIGIPRILDNLNTLARSLALEFNTVHNTGYTMPYNAVLSHNGVDFFDVPSGDYNLVTAKTLALSSDVLASAYNIAASDRLIDMSATNNQQGNNVIALKLVELTSRTDVTGVSNFENYLSSAIVELSIESAHCQKIYESQKVVSQNLENRRQSISGVSLDEEMIELVRYQHSYAAASRLITTIDEAMDVLINRTGMVGR